MEEKNSTNDSQQSERQRNIDNNARNIQNAAEVAIASKNPYAMAAGAAVKYGDKLTGGKVSQGLGSATERLNRHNPMGRRMQKASNKLAESGASDKIGQAASIKNGASGDTSGAAGALKSGVGGNNPQAANAGQEKLKSSLSKRGQNSMKKSKKKEDGSGEEPKDDSSNNDNNQAEELDNKASILKKKIKIKIIMIAGCAGIGIFLIILMIALISGIGSAIGSLFHIDYDEVFDKNIAAYYNRLAAIVEEYDDECSGLDGHSKLNPNYINAFLMYQFYIRGELPESIEYSNYYDMCAYLDEERKNELAECQDGHEYISSSDRGLLNQLNNLFDRMKTAKPDELCYLEYDSQNKENYLYKFLLEEMKKTQYNFMFYVGEGKEYDTYEKLLDEIFEYAESVSDSELEDNDNTDAIPETFSVETKDSNKSILIKDYIAGVIYANVDKSVLTNPERLKAYTVVYTTNIMSKNTITVNTQSISSDSIKDLRYCDPNSNCNGRGVISDIAKNTITNSINEVYGNVLVDENGKYETLSVDKLDNVDSDSFTVILSNAYEGYTLRNAKEDVYDNGVNYGNEKVLTDVTFYDQTNYTSSFCGLKNETIKSSGCGTTSMAIITSTYENDKKYDPVYMAEEARKQGHCSKGNGTYYGHFKYIANQFHYKYLAVKKTTDANKLNIVTSHLRQGHLIVVHVGAGHFTSGGHYMVLGGIDPATKSVYVYDPYNNVNKSYRKTGNGWYKFNDILKETKPAPTYIAFQIIWKD